MKKLSILAALALTTALASCASVGPTTSTSTNLTLPGSSSTHTSTSSSSTSTSTGSASVNSTLDLLSTSQTLLSGYKAIFGQDSINSLKSVLPSKVGSAVGLLDKTSSYVASLTADELELFKQIVSNSVANEKLWALVTGAKSASSTATSTSKTTGTTNSFLSNAAALQLATNLLGTKEPQQAQTALSYYNPQAADSTQQTVFSNLTNVLGSFLGNK